MDQTIFKFHTLLTYRRMNNYFIPYFSGSFDKHKAAHISHRHKWESERAWTSAGRIETDSSVHIVYCWATEKTNGNMVKATAFGSVSFARQNGDHALANEQNNKQTSKLTAYAFICLCLNNMHRPQFLSLSKARRVPWNAFRAFRWHRLPLPQYARRRPAALMALSLFSITARGA